MKFGNFLRSLRGQLWLIWMALLLLLVALYSVFLIGENSNHRSVVALSDAAIEALAKDSLMQRGQRLATQFAGNVAQPMLEADASSIALISRATLNQPDVQYVIVFDRKGRIVNAGDSADAVGRPMVDPLADAALLADTMKVQWADNLLDVAVPVRARDERIGGVRVGLVAGKPGVAQAKLLAPITAHMDAESSSRNFWVAAMLVVVLLFGASVVYVLDWRILEPIRKLGRIMAEDKPGQSARPSRRLGP